MEVTTPDTRTTSTIPSSFRSPPPSSSEEEQELVVPQEEEEEEEPPPQQQQQEQDEEEQSVLKDDDCAMVVVAPPLPVATLPPAPQQGRPPEEQQAEQEQEEEDPLDKVTWTDVEFDDNSKVATKILNRPALSYKSNELRKICSRLQVKLVRNPNKKEMVNHLYLIRKHKIDAAGVAESDKARRRAPQCGYRLMNILFCDQMAGQFARIGDVADKATLDKGMAVNNEQFWREVESLFTEEDQGLVDPTINVLHFTEDDVFCDEIDNIDMKGIVKHAWKKLHNIWKSILKEYKAINQRFTCSGNHESCFFNFCNGKKEEPYYLYLHLTTKPELAGQVNAGLPNETFKESGVSSSASCSSVTPGTPSSSTRKRKKRRSDSISTPPNKTIVAGSGGSPEQQVLLVANVLDKLAKSRSQDAVADREAERAARLEEQEAKRIHRMEEKVLI